MRAPQPASVDVVEADAGAHRDARVRKGVGRRGDVVRRRIVDDGVDRPADGWVELGGLLVRRPRENELDVGVVLAFELGLVGRLPVGAEDLHAHPSDCRMIIS